MYFNYAAEKQKLVGTWERFAPAKPEPFHSSERLGWLDEIEDEQLYKRLRKLKRKDLELLTLVVLEGYTQADVAKMAHVAPSTICVKIKRIKAFLRGEKGGGRKRRKRGASQILCKVRSMM